MPDQDLNDLKNSFKNKSKDELLAIWTENNRHAWPVGTFELIKEELQRRGADIPRQKPPEESLGKEVDFRKDVGDVFFAVTPVKLAVMSVATFGFYDIFWFYRNWKFLKEKHGFKVHPFGRALLCLFYCFSFFRNVKQYAEQNGVSASYKPGTLAACFIGLSVLWKLPEPLDMLSYLSFIPLLTVQRTINAIQDKLNPGSRPADKFTGWNIFGIVVGSAVWALWILGLIFPEKGTP